MRKWRQFELFDDQSNDFGNQINDENFNNINGFDENESMIKEELQRYEYDEDDHKDHKLVDDSVINKYQVNVNQYNSLEEDIVHYDDNILGANMSNVGLNHSVDNEQNNINNNNQQLNENNNEVSEEYNKDKNRIDEIYDEDSKEHNIENSKNNINNNKGNRVDEMIERISIGENNINNNERLENKDNNTTIKEDIVHDDNRISGVHMSNVDLNYSDSNEQNNINNNNQQLNENNNEVLVEHNIYDNNDQQFDEDNYEVSEEYNNEDSKKINFSRVSRINNVYRSVQININKDRINDDVFLGKNNSKRNSYNIDFKNDDGIFKKMEDNFDYNIGSNNIYSNEDDYKKDETIFGDVEKSSSVKQENEKSYSVKHKNNNVRSNNNIQFEAHEEISNKCSSCLDTIIDMLCFWRKQ